MKIEYLKPVLHIDQYFKLADFLIRSDDREMEQIGRAMRQVYNNQMVESEMRQVEEEVDAEAMAFQRNEAELEAEEELMSDVPEDRMKQFQNPDECKSGVCD